MKKRKNKTMQALEPAPPGRLELHRIATRLHPDQVGWWVFKTALWRRQTPDMLLLHGSHLVAYWPPDHLCPQVAITVQSQDLLFACCCSYTPRRNPGTLVIQSARSVLHTLLSFVFADWLSTLLVDFLCREHDD